MIYLKDKFNITDSAIIGLSGGPDSMALLHLLAPEVPGLTAVHVNYGVSPHADEWEKICSEYCESLNVPFKSYKCKFNVEDMRNFEARARDERYKIFSSHLANNYPKNVFLAHNLDDQIETFFLKLKSGNGLRGLKAMNRVSKMGDLGLVVFRPLLSFSREEIMAYIDEHSIPYVIDESNNDDRYDRNFIRHQIIPLFESRFGNFRKTMEKVVFSLNDSKFCLDDLAEKDLSLVLCDEDDRISIEKIRNENLALQRIRNMLQYYLNSKNFTTSYNDLIQFSNNLVKVSYDNSLELYLKSRNPGRYVLKQNGKYLSIVETRSNSNRYKRKRNNKN